MKIAIQRYGRTLLLPAENAFDTLDLIEIENSKPKRYSLRFDFWTAEDGRSDLTLEATIIEDIGHLRWEIDNIHVL